MRRSSLTLAACAVLLVLVGCGSSSKSSDSTGTTAAKTTPSSGGLKVTTTPKFASPSPSAPVRSGLVKIAYRNIAIDPDTLRVKVGSTVKWTNFDSVQHNVISQRGPQKFSSEDFGEGGSYEVKLTKPGTINYECTIHPASMNGTIEVVS